MWTSVGESAQNHIGNSLGRFDISGSDRCSGASVDDGAHWSVDRDRAIAAAISGNSGICRCTQRVVQRREGNGFYRVEVAFYLTSCAIEISVDVGTIDRDLHCDFVKVVETFDEVFEFIRSVWKVRDCRSHQPFAVLEQTCTDVGVPTGTVGFAKFGQSAGTDLVRPQLSR